jgi:hypothetical protein
MLIHGKTHVKPASKTEVGGFIAARSWIYPTKKMPI